MRTRNKSIPIRVTEKELQAIDEAAKKAKKNRTEYLISAALGKEITVIEDLREMIVQLKRIGNNLNQLTRKANAHEIETCDWSSDVCSSDLIVFLSFFVFLF